LVEKSRLGHKSWCSILAACGYAASNHIAIVVGLWFLQTPCPLILSSWSFPQCGRKMRQAPTSFKAQIFLWCVCYSSGFFSGRRTENIICTHEG